MRRHTGTNPWIEVFQTLKDSKTNEEKKIPCTPPTQNDIPNVFSPMVQWYSNRLRNSEQATVQKILGNMKGGDD